MSERTGKKKRNKTKKRHYVSAFTWFAILFAGIATLACALFFILGWSLNAYYVSEARKGRYHVGMEEFYTLIPFPDEYVVWYNIGNYYFEKGNYSKAEDAYLKSIDCGIPYEKECPVKINLALSMLAQISDDEWDEYLECDGPDDVTANARRVERILEDAWEVLVEDGCAHADDEDGHDKQAQLLKDEIEELLEKHSDPEEDDEDDDDGDPGDDEDDEDEQEDEEDGEDEGNGSIDEEEIMEHIQEMLDDNQQERADDQQLYEELYGIGVDEGSLDGMQGEVW